MEALRGSCGVQSRKDGKQGSRFYFSFPYRPDKSAGDLEGDRASTKPSSSLVTPLKSLKILLVDDSMSILKITGRALTVNSHLVTTGTHLLISFL
jgi:hypothetical protein